MPVCLRIFLSYGMCGSSTLKIDSFYMSSTFLAFAKFTSVVETGVDTV